MLNGGGSKLGHKLPIPSLGADYEITVECANGHAIIRMRLVKGDTGLPVTLTFPVETVSNLDRFKQRLIQMILNKQNRRQGTA